MNTGPVLGQYCLRFVSILTFHQNLEHHQFPSQISKPASVNRSSTASSGPQGTSAAMMALQETEMHIVDVVERTSSALSLLGAAFIISTFLTNKGFHKPINRLVFYACWGNLMTNIATLISLSGPRTGVNGPLCQFQGFLIQMYVLLFVSIGTNTDVRQVHACRRFVDSSNGLQCLLSLLPQV